MHKLVLVSVALFLISCQSGKKQTVSKLSKERPMPDPKIIAEGHKIARALCQRCHEYPSSNLLPKHIWKQDVLPRMGAFNGIYGEKSRSELIEKGKAEKIVKAANIYPSHPLIDSSNWKAIKAFYLSKAPTKLKNPVSYDSLQVKNIFHSYKPDLRIKPPMTTMVDYEKKSGLIYQSDVKRDISTLNIFQKFGKEIQSIALRSPAVQIREKDGSLWVLTMGSFTSTDAPTGRLLKIRKTKKVKKCNAVQVMIDNLRRPVDVGYADFDGDGDEDIVIAEFGNWVGRLEWFEKINSGEYKKHLLMSKVGAIKVKVTDLNNDNKPDMLVMTAQGDESIYAFLNKGDGNFKKKRLIQLPPSYGSVYFDYVDMNGDGIKDIIHVAGDNADYESIPKPYHGIRIYLGKGNLRFKKPWFFPQHGAYKVIAKDFDGDGDLDLASISFFPDYTHSAKESFMMLENISNNGSLKFKPFTIPEFNSSRWNTMCSGDFNHDGKPDLILGSFVVQNPYGDQGGIKKKWMANSPMFLILYNKWFNKFSKHNASASDD